MAKEKKNINTVKILSEEEDKCECIKRDNVPLKKKYREENEDMTIPDKEKIQKLFKTSVLNKCSHQKLNRMKREENEMNLFIKEDAKPQQARGIKHVPKNMEDKVKAQIDEDVRMGIIKPVEKNRPDRWISRMVVTRKANGEPRRTIDFRQLNKAALRQTANSESPKKMVSEIPEKRYYTVIDMWQAFHSIPMRKEDRHFTTFKTQWGDFEYKVYPQGFLSSTFFLSHSARAYAQ